MAAAGIHGVAFSPYVGPWVSGAPVLFNTYTLEQVTRLLDPVAKNFSLVASYGQGTFVWQGVPNIQDSNRYITQAANNVGLKVSAGCYQQGADSGQTPSMSSGPRPRSITHSTRQKLMAT